MKRLIVCCDGTWNAADSAVGAETNVFRLAKAIHATHGATGTQQIVLYLRGVGTTGLKIGDLIQGAFGYGIDDNIRSAYMFLAQNYETDDKIFLFGFSRGAYTARSLVGFIHLAGLLKRGSLGDIHSAWAFYRQKGVATKQAPKPAVDTVHAGVAIKFLGVWDTVGALGIPGSLFSDFDAESFGFHSTDASPIVHHGCQALAIDEHRDAFVPTLWTGTLPTGTTIDQTWFAGVHSDVGGGYHSRALADIPLSWMTEHAAGDKLEIDWHSLAALTTSADPHAATHESRTGVFMVDKLRPTWREVCQKPFQVLFYERLYAPMDTNQNRLKTINEKIHASVIERFNTLSQLCDDDATGAASSAIYEPKSIDIFTGPNRAFAPDTPIDSFAWPMPGPAAAPSA